MRCRAFWSILRPLYVVNPADADRIDWGRCNLPNERNALRYLSERIVPSIQALSFTATDLSAVTAPILIVHGRRDRSAPYGGALDCASLLPDARLVTIDHAAHAPWIEDPERVFGSIAAFLNPSSTPVAA